MVGEVRPDDASLRPVLEGEAAELRPGGKQAQQAAPRRLVSHCDGRGKIIALPEHGQERLPARVRVHKVAKRHPEADRQRGVGEQGQFQGYVGDGRDALGKLRLEREKIESEFDHAGRLPPAGQGVAAIINMSGE